MEHKISINNESMLPVGTILHGVYRVDNYLSSGGFGNTYIVTQLNLNEVYAIKEIFMRGIVKRNNDGITISIDIKENLVKFHDQLEKFKKEARRIRKLNNNHIVHVYDLFEENGTAYYVMDYVNGENLKALLDRTGRPMSEEKVCKILTQILDALQTVHDAGIWHLDLKPANIMVDKAGNVKLIDFGASKQLNAQKGGATTSTAISYTNGYAPREQMEQRYDKFGPWTDFYALGGTIYTLLTCRIPPMPTDIDDDNSADKNVSLPLYEVSKEMKQLVLWLMQTDRRNRPVKVIDILHYLNRSYNIFDESCDDSIDKDFSVTLVKDKLPEISSLHANNESRSNIPVQNRSYKTLIIATVSFSLILILSLFLYYSWNKELWKQNPQTIFVKEPLDSMPRTVLNKAIVISQGECTYTGEINEKGIPDGKGQAWFKDGRYYKGFFVNGDLNGDNAYFTNKQGDIFEGSFDNNQISSGTFTINSTGEYFRGTFHNGNPLHGKWYDKEGNVLEDI